MGEQIHANMNLLHTEVAQLQMSIKDVLGRSQSGEATSVAQLARDVADLKVKVVSSVADERTDRISELTSAKQMLAEWLSEEIASLNNAVVADMKALINKNTH